MNVERGTYASILTAAILAVVACTVGGPLLPAASAQGGKLRVEDERQIKPPPIRSSKPIEVERQDSASPGAESKGGNLIDLPRPGDREFVLDEAHLLLLPDKEKVQEIAGKLLKEKAAPIIVVTIDSMAAHGGAGMRIETFARLLFDQWGIGPATIGENKQLWNYGMLLLVSKGDRKARIELGAGWRHDKDVEAQKVMDELIIPKFKAGDFSGGIVAGVEGLNNVARDLKLPAAAPSPRPQSHYWIAAAFVGLIVFTVVSLIRRGASGWAWLMWAAIFGIIGTILYQMAQNSGRSGGGYSGGSFGGGFSGGGGASGSW